MIYKITPTKEAEEDLVRLAKSDQKHLQRSNAS